MYRKQELERNDMRHDSSCAFTTLNSNHLIWGRTAEPRVSCSLAGIGV